MIDGSEKRNRQLAFELHNSHFCEMRCQTYIHWLLCLTILLHFQVYYMVFDVNLS